MNNKVNRTIIIVSSIIVSLLIALSIWVYVDEDHPFRPYLESFIQTENDTPNVDNHNNHDEDNTNNDEQNDEVPEPEPEPEPKPDEIVTLSLAAAGDFMFHSTQVSENFINPDTGKYDFSSFFADVAPIFQKADLAIANFETTTAGDAYPYSGYPQFNTPDEAIGDIRDAGLDVLVTANNHSLDTGSHGLKRTAKMMKEFNVDSIGTYEEAPESRILMKEVNGLKIAILAYTESTNGLGDQYDPDTLHSMINLMEKDLILADIEAAKEADADLIISFMHWGIEYATEPNDKQIEYAEMMAEAGVHIIFGSHPHVIQKSDFIKTDDFNTFVIYSLGNFISNQRRETLGEEFARTEDGVIVLLEVEKNITQDTLKILSVDYVPTWVSRTGTNGIYEYRVLPIERHINDDALQSIQEKLERSYEATMSKLDAVIPVTE